MAMSAGTHIDALGHLQLRRVLYNGFPADTVTAVDGLTRCGADKIGPIMSRGVLLDLPAAQRRRSTRARLRRSPPTTSTRPSSCARVDARAG